MDTSRRSLNPVNVRGHRTSKTMSPKLDAGRRDESAATTIPDRIGIQYAAAVLQTEANPRRAFD